jgi:hypothetical protein
MGVTGSPFCEHKKLRTGCAICKPAALPSDAGLRATPFVTEEEREKAAAKRERRADRPATAGAPTDDEAQPKIARPTGPGKPLLPQRKRANRNISAEEADAVKPWWVKK